MSKELHYYNKYKCPVCGCEHIVIKYTKEFHHVDEEHLARQIVIIKCTNPDCNAESKAVSEKFGGSNLFKVWEKVEYPYYNNSYILDEFLMKACNLYKTYEENAVLKETLKILRPCTDIEVETIYATEVLGTTKPFLTVKKGHTIRHEFTRSDIDVLEEGFRILDKEEQK